VTIESSQNDSVAANLNGRQTAPTGLAFDIHNVTTASLAVAPGVTYAVILLAGPFLPELSADALLDITKKPHITTTAVSARTFLDIEIPLAMV
jgi:hypothetical protein